MAQIKEGEMLDDLMVLLEELVQAKKKVEWKGWDAENKEVVRDNLVNVMMKIIKRHAYPWYEGDIHVATERRDRFVEKASTLATDVLPLRKKPHELSEAWMNGICEIDEGYEPVDLLKEVLSPQSLKEQIRIWTYTSTHKGQAQWAMGNALRERMHKADLKYQANLQRTASNRFKTEKDKECSN